MHKDMMVEKDVACKLSDGTILRADIYRPDDQLTHPVLMLRLPYDKTVKRYYDEYVRVPRMVEAGYVVILQDVRGRFASEGEFYPFINEGKDGYEAVEWAARLPYANGKVGLFGTSYHGYTQLAAAAEMPPSLKAIAPVMTMADPWQDLLGGASLASSSANFQTWTLGSIVHDQLQRRHDPKADRALELIEQLPELLQERPANDWWPMKELDPESFYFEVMDGELPAEQIANMSVKEQLKDVTIPALFMGGWYDALLSSTLAAYHAYNGPRMLWIGPWTHEEMTGHAGEKFFSNAETNIGVDQIQDPTEIHIKWFDKWLKDKPMPIEKPVHLYLMGQEKWAAFDVWPPTTEQRVLYLDSKGHAQTRDGDGRLSTVPANQETLASLRLDPDNPVPTRGGGALIAGYESGVFAIGDIQDRGDVLVYTATAQEDALSILGTVRASIWVSAATPLTDLAVRLSDVAPNGEVINIIDAFHRQQTNTIGEPACMDLTIGHTAYLLQAGHQLRLDIAASNSPLYDVNLNNGQTTKTAIHGKVAYEHVYHGGSRSSKIILPIVNK